MPITSSQKYFLALRTQDRPNHQEDLQKQFSASGSYKSLSEKSIMAGVKVTIGLQYSSIHSDNA